MCQSQALLGIGIFAGAWWAFVQGHHDICTYASLYVHDSLGSEDMLASVYVTAKGTSLLSKFPYARE